MTTQQPVWKFVANLGDANPIDYGGLFIFQDETGVYPEEAELLVVEDEDSDDGPWTVYRFILEQCTFQDGILSDNKFHPEHAAWFAKPESERASRPQDNTYLADVASFVGQSVEELVRMLCSEDSCERAEAYRAIGDFHGWDNFDSDPLEFTNRAEVEERYKDCK